LSEERSRQREAQQSGSDRGRADIEPPHVTG